MKKALKVKSKRYKKDMIYFFLINDLSYIGLGGGSTVGVSILPLVLAIRKTKF